MYVSVISRGVSVFQLVYINCINILICRLH